MSAFGDFLYTLRKERAMTQAELAGILGVTNKAVSKWETGEAMPDTGLLLPISRVFDVTVDELLMGARAEASVNIETSAENFDRDAKDSAVNVSNNYDSSANNNSPQNSSEQTEQKEKFSDYPNSDEKLSSRQVVIIDKRVKDSLDKIKDGICSIVVLIGVIIFFILGLISGKWSNYWVVLSTCGLLSGIIGIIFDLCNKKRREEKLARGENPYMGAICGLIMLTCVIVYTCLGAFLDLWHPGWIICACGGIVCAIANAVIAILSARGKKDNQTKDKD